MISDNQKSRTIGPRRIFSVFLFDFVTSLTSSAWLAKSNKTDPIYATPSKEEKEENLWGKRSLSLSLSLSLALLEPIKQMKQKLRKQN